MKPLNNGHQNFMLSGRIGRGWGGGRRKDEGRKEMDNLLMPTSFSCRLQNIRQSRPALKSSFVVLRNNAESVVAQRKIYNGSTKSFSALIIRTPKEQLLLHISQENHEKFTSRFCRRVGSGRHVSN